MAASLLQAAEHSSEAELRSSLSRLYYALFHVAAALTGVHDHGNLPEALNQLYPPLGEELKLFRDLRSGADYNPNFLRQFEDLSKFHANTLIYLEQGRRLYKQLVRLCEDLP